MEIRNHNESTKENTRNIRSSLEVKCTEITRLDNSGSMLLAPANHLFPN